MHSEASILAALVRFERRLLVWKLKLSLVGLFVMYVFELGRYVLSHGIEVFRAISDLYSH